MVGHVHDEVHVVLDEQHVSFSSSRSRRMNAASSPTSSWLSPPAGSSSSSRRGFETSARASSTRFSVPNGSPAAGRLGDAGDADEVERLERGPLRGALALEARDACARRRARSRARSSSGTARRSGTCARSRAGSTPLGGVRRSDLPSKTTSPCVEPVEPRDHVERRRLAGAVRADQPGDRAFLDVERDVVERDDAAEAQGDVAHREETHPDEEPMESGAASTGS